MFQDDRAALAWYDREINLRSFTANMGRSELWRFLREQILDESNGFTPHDLRDVMGNTPSVGGMIPKLLVSMDVGRDDTTLYPPGAPGKVDVLLKIEPPEYQGCSRSRRCVSTYIGNMDWIRPGIVISNRRICASWRLSDSTAQPSSRWNRCSP